MASELPEKILELDDGEDSGDRDPEQEQQEEAEERERFVVFRLGDTRYAVGVEAVRSVVEVGEYTRVPRSSPAVDGVMDLRGDITAIVDPQVFLPADESQFDPDEQRILVFDRPADHQDVGIRVDRVTGVEAIPVSRIFSRPTPAEGVEERILEHGLVTAVISQRAGDDAFDTISLLDIDGLVAVAGDA
jgi:purine-binding chemotaxis protein CheW